MATVHLVLVILALVSFLLAALEVSVPRVRPGEPGRYPNLVAAGLFLWLISTLVPAR
jgi:hypothetical protein